MMFSMPPLNFSPLLMPSIAVAILFWIWISRYLFHPLARFPGHPVFAISDFPLAICVRSGRSFAVMKEMHRKYGNVIRIGPNKLSILDPSVLHTVYKSAQCFEKDDAYALGASKGQGIFFIQDRSRHAKRRAVWAQAFTSASIETYTPYLEMTINRLMTVVMKNSVKGPVNLGRVFQHWTFDFMGLMTFGPSKPFNLLESDDPNHFVENCQEAAEYFQTLGEVPFTFKLLTYLPLPNPIHQLQKLSEQKIKDAQSSEESLSGAPTICSLLLKAGLSHADVIDDVLFAIQAGFEATATVLTFAMYYLVSDQDILLQLRAELDHVFGPPSPSRTTPVLNYGILAELPYLNAVVKEALRLGSPFPGLTRVTPQPGVMLGGHYVPGGTIVGVPVHALHFSSKHFSPSPEKFEPRRWLPGKDGEEKFETDESALITFSFGPFGCLGRQLAMKELLVLIATLVHNFDFTSPDNFEQEKFLDGVRNMKITYFDVPLMVQVKSRAS